MYIVEPSPVALAIALHIHDWRDLLRDPRVKFFIGEGASERLGSE